MKAKKIERRPAIHTHTLAFPFFSRIVLINGKAFLPLRQPKSIMAFSLSHTFGMRREKQGRRHQRKEQRSKTNFERARQPNASLTNEFSRTFSLILSPYSLSLSLSLGNIFFFFLFISFFFFFP